MTYEEAISQVEALHQFGPRPGLERIRKLMDKLGNPQDKLHFIHVAGTNGKGTTCTLLASVLRCAGYRTGLFVSPHVTDFRERIQIDGHMISQQEFASLAERVFPAIQEMESQGYGVTEFEAITAMALLWYAQKSCDLVVLEVGLGGRLDATNVIAKSLVSVITSVSLDHTKILGDTIEQIAYEKCGIMKERGVTVSYSNQSPDALKVIRQIATQRRNRLIDAANTEVRKISTDLSGTELSWHQIRLHLPLLGNHQVKNAATVLTVLDYLRETGCSISDESIVRGFSQVTFPARFEVLSRSPIVILDGAHNADGTKVLAQSIREYLSGRDVVAVMGMLQDKDVETAVQNLSGLLSCVITTEPPSTRALSADVLAERWRQHGICAEAAVGYDEALRMADTRRKPNGAVLICGSLYLAGDLRPRALQFWHPLEK